MNCIELSFLQISNISVTVISLFLGIHFLLLNKDNKKTNRLLGCFLILMSFSVTGDFIENNDIHLQIFDYFSLLNSSGLITLILLYYSFSLTRPNNENVTKYRCLLLFPVLEIVTNLLFEITDPNVPVIAEDIIYITLYYLTFLYNFAIYIIILKEIKIHNKNILRLFSSIDNKRLNWLKILVLINIGFMIIWFVDDTLAMMVGENIISGFLSATSYIATVLTILWIGFSSLRQNPIYESVDMQSYSPTKTNTDGLLPFPDLKQKYERVSDQIVKEKLFLDQDLSLGALAKIVNLKPKELTLIINKGFGDNFYHFINCYRVQHYKFLLEQSDSDIVSIEGRAYNCGFKSKSTFYSAFKKIEGITPREYELRKNSSNSLSHTE